MQLALLWVAGPRESVLLLLGPLVLGLVECGFQILRRLVEARPDILPGSFVFTLSRPHLSLQFRKGMLSRVDGCLNFVPHVGLQQRRLDRKGLESQLRVRQPFLKTVLKCGALLVETPFHG